MANLRWHQQPHCSGDVTWTLVCPLRPGQRRPVVSVLAEPAEVIAISFSGYARRFEDANTAMAWIEEAARAWMES